MLHGDSGEKKSTVADSYSVGSPLPPANILTKMRAAPTTVPDSHSVGSLLPSGTPAALRLGTAIGAAEILIENARLEFRVNHRKQMFAIKSNRERMAFSFHENPRKRAGETPIG